MELPSGHDLVFHLQIIYQPSAPNPFECVDFSLQRHSIYGYDASCQGNGSDLLGDLLLNEISGQMVVADLLQRGLEACSPRLRLLSLAEALCREERRPGGVLAVELSPLRDDFPRGEGGLMQRREQEAEHARNPDD